MLPTLVQPLTLSPSVKRLLLDVSQSPFLVESGEKMKLDRVNQLLQVAANLGVILSITFLAFELSQNRDMMTAQTRNEITQGAVELLTLAVNDGDFQRIIRRARSGEEMSEDEQWQFERHQNGWFRYWENMHYQYRNGLFDEIEFAGQIGAIGAGLSVSPGIVNYWCRVRSLYSPEFAREMEGLLTC